MEGLPWLLLVAAGIVAGALNAVAGGGSFVTLPALVAFGLPALGASASSTVALVPGYIASAWVGRRHLRARLPVPAAAMLTGAMLAAATGAGLLLASPERLFAAIVPWLVLAATFVFWLGAPRAVATAGAARPLPLLLIACLYGGYFNGALGVVLLAALVAGGVADAHVANAWKNALSALVSLVAAVVLGIGDVVAWEPTLFLMAATIVGGVLGGLVADRLPARGLRGAVVLVGLAAATALGLQAA